MIAYLACLLALALCTQLAPGSAANALAYTLLSPAEVKTMVGNGTAGTIIDVREYDEYCPSGHIPCALNYPWNSGYLQNHSAELDPDSPYIIVCRSGSRSASASAFLESQGFTNISAMSGGMNSWQGATQMCDAQCPAIYFPHIATGTPWQTEIAIINTGDRAIAGTLKALSDEGQILKVKTVPLLARARRQMAVADEFANLSNIGYITFSAGSPSIQGYTKFYIEGRYRAAIPAVTEVNSTDIQISHIASDAEWWTGISLVNTTSSQKVLTITFNNGQVKTVPLNANEHKAFDIAGLFDDQPQPGIVSAVITNASGVVGLELFGRTNNKQLDGILLTDKTASTLYYPHVAGGEWWTGIVAYNPSALSCGITITPYSAQGTLLAPSAHSIPGKGKYIGAVAALGLSEETAWFRIDSTRPLSGFELFGTTDGEQLAPYAGGGGTGAKAGVFAKIEKLGWTGIAFVNTEDSAASVTLTAYRDSGTTVAAQVLPVGSHAKVVQAAEDIFLPQEISDATYIAYSSDKNVVGFQLNGSMDWTMLDGLPALAVPASDSTGLPRP
jgi:rhodanese-related sulfurtransferase